VLTRGRHSSQNAGSALALARIDEKSSQRAGSVFGSDRNNLALARLDKISGLRGSGSARQKYGWHGSGSARIVKIMDRLGKNMYFCPKTKAISCYLMSFERSGHQISRLPELI
jgi:hypothetical protein